ncbi:MAG: hypothetical protein BMS9Abin36_1846 [Gammaproteobacteria bacterium]|nr:MAG: hypothetical protein BMS9Abin36_1846 [Gammaproteobacteria bacterium]
MQDKTDVSSPYWSYFFRAVPSWQQQALAQLSKTRLFADIPKRSLRHLVCEMYYRNYQQNEAVFATGDPGLGMYLVLTGKVEIYIGDKIFAELERGEFFGEVALLGDETRTASARVVGETELVGFFRPTLEEWLQRSPKQGARFLFNLGRLVAERLRRSNEMCATPSDL